MLPNLELGMTFLLAYEKIRKEMKEIEERGELQQHQVPEDSLPKVNKAKSERHKFVRLPYPSSVRMMYQNICKNCVKLKKLLKTKKKTFKNRGFFPSLYNCRTKKVPDPLEKSTHLAFSIKVTNYFLEKLALHITSFKKLKT